MKNEERLIIRTEYQQIVTLGIIIRCKGHSIIIPSVLLSPFFKIELGGKVWQLIIKS